MNRNGPTKISVAVSGMMGTISGSAVAKTVITGTFTIPLMKRIGFESHVAGAVEIRARCRISTATGEQVALFLSTKNNYGGELKCHL